MLMYSLILGLVIPENEQKRPQTDESSPEIPLDFVSNNCFSAKFLGRQIIPCLNSSLSSSSLDEDIIEVLKCTLSTSRMLSLQVTYHLQFALVVYKLDICKNTSRTPVKVLLNWISTKLHNCSATPVITSRRLVTRTCNNVY